MVASIEAIPREQIHTVISMCREQRFLSRSYLCDTPRVGRTESAIMLQTALLIGDSLT